MSTEPRDITQQDVDLGIGWTLAYIPGLGVHSLPVGDTHDHMDEDCPCIPVQNEDGLWEHNSFDGREAFEDGTRKAS